MDLIRNKRKRKKDTRIAVTYEDALNIFTDGSCQMHDKRKGGIGVRFVLYNQNLDEEIIEPWFDGYKDSTINEMELQAVIEALKYAKRNKLYADYQRIIVFSDSMYVVDNFNRAKYEWRTHNWFNKYGKPIENADQWKELVKIVSTLPKSVEIKKVKAHGKDENNKSVDRLAKRGAQGTLKNPISTKSVRRKKTNEITNIGSVQMRGQRITIRIVSSEYERLQNLFKLRYEVISKSSPYYGCLDLIFSNNPLRAGHTYFVKVNDQSENPRIDKVFRECK